MDTFAWNRILAATDFSPFGDKAVNYAHDLAEKVGAELHVVHIARSTTDASVIHGITGVFDPNTDAEQESDWVKNILGESGTVRRVQVVEIGHDIPDKIVNYAEHNQIDLIVLASHGRKGLQRLWLGSNAEQVARSAPCPVLILRPSHNELDNE